MKYGEQVFEKRITLKEHIILSDWLEYKAKRVNRYNQEDYYFDLPKPTYMYIDPLGRVNYDGWLRIRTSDKGDSFCYKHVKRDPKSHKLISTEEIETVIESGLELKNILLQAKFVMTMPEKRVVEKWKYKKFTLVYEKVGSIRPFVSLTISLKCNDKSEAMKEIEKLIKKDIELSKYSTKKLGVQK